MSDQIDDVVEAMRNVALKFFEYQPLTSPVIDSYNQMTSVDLIEIIEERGTVYFETETQVGTAEFKNVTILPPFKNSIPAEVTNLRNRMTRNNERLTPEDLNRLYKQDLELDAPVKPHPSWMIPADVRDASSANYMLSVYADVVITRRNKQTQNVAVKLEEPDAALKKNEDDDDDIELADLIIPALFEGTRDNNASINTYNFVHLFKLPLMTGSQWDWIVLSGAPESDWSYFRECQQEVFGNFIINSKEKVFVTQEKLAQNIPRCIIIRDGKPSMVCSFRSEAPDKRSVTAVLHSFLRSPKKIEIVTLELPFLMKGDKKHDFNVLSVFRFFAIFALHEIRSSINPNYNIINPDDDLPDSKDLALSEFNHYLMESCSSGTETNKTYSTVVAYLFHTIQDMRLRSTSDVDFINIFAERLNFPTMPYDLQVRSIKKFFDAELFPHVGANEYHLGLSDDPESEWEVYPKFYTLASMIVRFVKVRVGAKSLDDRDAYTTKALATVGIELSSLAEKAFKVVRNFFRQKLSKNLEQTLNSVPQDLEQLGKVRVTNPIASAFSSGNWGLPQKRKRTGVVQAHEVSSIAARLNMVRKVSIPIRKQSQIAAPRQVPDTSYGVVDPTNTPDSNQVGLVKALAIATYITNYDRSSETWAWAIAQAMIYPDDAVEQGIYNQSWIGQQLVFEVRDGNEELLTFFINNVWVGFAKPQVVEHYKLEKRSGRLGRYTELFVKVENDQLQTVKEFHVLTSSGRPVKPWFVVDQNNEFVALKLGLLDPNKIRSLTIEDLIEKGALEFAGPNEFEFSEMAIDFKAFLAQSRPPTSRRFSHIEVDPSYQLAVEGAAQPFAQYNPIPRVMYRGNQIRQAQSIPITTFGSRFETDLKIINYAQKPLVSTDMIKVSGLDQQPSGLNVTLFVMSTGFTDEDATVWKKEFLERGGFNTTLFETYSIEGSNRIGDADDDDVRLKDGVIRVRNEIDPYDQDEIEGVEESNKEAERELNPKLPKMSGRTNVLVKPGDLLARFEVNKSTAEVKELKLKGNRTGIIHSTHFAHGSPSVQKIAVRFPHIPGKGDKFSGPAGQKGVIGEVRPMIDMPFTADGTYPDVIFSPTSFASRMTVALFLEMISGKASISCNIRRFVNRLVSYERGDPDVKIEKDFYIKLNGVLSNDSNSEIPAITVEEVRSYIRSHVLVFKNKTAANVNNLTNTVKRLVDVKDSEQVKKMKDFLLDHNDFRANNDINEPQLYVKSAYFEIAHGRGMVARYSQSSSGLRDRETLLDELTEEAVEQMLEGDWKLSYAIKFNDRDDSRKVKYLAPNPDHVTVLKTGEPHILFSQLNSKYRIQWYLEHREDIVPQFRLKDLDRDLDKEYERLRDATPFRSIDDRKIKDLLVEKGFTYSGKERVMNKDGRQMEAQVFTGPCYYLHLKHLVQTKQQSRDKGANSLLTRAPVRGKALGGAVKSGEMTRVAGLAHGATRFLSERFRTGADEFKGLVCGKCGTWCYLDNQTKSIFCEGCRDTDPIEVTTTWALRKQHMLLGAAGTAVKLNVRPLQEPIERSSEAILDEKQVRDKRWRQSRAATKVKKFVIDDE